MGLEGTSREQGLRGFAVVWTTAGRGDVGSSVFLPGN